MDKTTLLTRTTLAAAGLAALLATAPRAQGAEQAPLEAATALTPPLPERNPWRAMPLPQRNPLRVADASGNVPLPVRNPQREARAEGEVFIRDASPSANFFEKMREVYERRQMLLTFKYPCHGATWKAAHPALGFCI